MKIKKLLLSALALMWICPMASAQQYRIEHDDWQSLQISFTVNNLGVDKTTAFGREWNTLSVDGYLPSAAVGAPNLPTFSRLIEVPLCDAMEVSVTDAVYDTLKALSMPVMPVQPARTKSDKTPAVLAMDRAIYETDAYYGIDMAVVEEVGVARDRRLARLQFSPVRYNPVSGQVVVCRSATVTVSYRNADLAATKDMFDRYNSPLFQSGSQVINASYPKSSTSAPVRMLIIAHSSFQNRLDEFVLWKRRKGFITDIVYTSDPAVGTTTTSIAAYIKSQYTNATASNPAPTYLLLVGDVAQIPAFNGTTQNSHITDLYYTTWTDGDIIPDCFHGRFSAQNLTQLQPQIDKTLMYEQYTFADPTFLDRAVMVAGVDGGSAGDHGYTHADPAMDYAIINYINGEHGWSQVMYFKNNTSIVPSGSNVTVGSSAGSNSATVRSYYNQGAGWINYSAHGGSTGWGTPSFGNTDVNQMTNVQKFGLLIGNCCQTNMYGESTCFGEALLRKDNYCGAVGYIGGSDYTYWGEDFYWAVGLRSSISATMSMDYNSSNRGAYDYLCHTHNEPYSQWAISNGELMYSGNMAVQSSTSSLKNYYWEIYHLMGDPSVMSYLTQANEATVTVMPTIMLGTTSLPVTTVPYAYVALTDTLTHSLVASGFANAQGTVTLTLPASLTVGGYELAVSAQQYRVTFRNISVVNPQGVYVVVTALTPQGSLDAGSERQVSVTVSNAGTQPASNVVMTFTSSDASLVITPETLTIASLAAGASTTLTGALTAAVSPAAADNSQVNVIVSTEWDDSSSPAEVQLPFTLKAPVLTYSITGDLRVLPGGNATVGVVITNNGHAALPAGTLQLQSPTSLLTVTPVNNSAFGIAAGATVQRNYNLHADAQLPQGYDIPLHLFLDGTLPLIDAEHYMYVGETNKDVETFENNQFHFEGWVQGESPDYGWSIVNTGAYAGSYCARSYSGLTDNETSRMNITCTWMSDDSVTFFYKVSSESGYDKFFFYIDDNELLVKSGEVAWSRASYPVTAGTHTLQFVYSKDYSYSNGSDCAWVDNITLPVVPHHIYFDSVELCVGEVFVVNGNTLNTTTAGSGIIQETDDDDNIIVLSYTIYPAAMVFDTIDACDHYTFNGTEYTHSANFYESHLTEEGCDSIFNIRLNIHYSTSGTYFDTVYGNSYTWNDSIYTESGIYQQVLTSMYGCDSTVILLLTILPDDTTGIDGVEALSIKVYPTPTTGMVHLSEVVDEVQVFDMSGRMLLQGKNTDAVDLTRMPQGSYVLKVTLLGRQASCRVVKR